MRVWLSTDDPDLSIWSGALHTEWPVGEARNNGGAELTVAADASPHDAELVVHVEADHGGPWTFPITLPIVVAQTEFLLWSHWLAGDDRFRGALPGERILPRVRLRNAGPAATNVVVTIASADSDVTVITGEASHATWPAAEKRNINGFVVDIAQDAEPHDIEVIVTVAADDGGPWAFTYSIPIAAAARGSAVGARRLEPRRTSLYHRHPRCRRG